MKKCLAVLFSVALLLVALVVLSGCSPKAQPAQPQQSVQPAAPAAQAPEVATQTAQPATKTAPATAPSASKPAVPAPAAQNNFDKYLAGLPGKFDAANAQGVTCTYQFNITSGDPGLYWVKIANGQCTLGDGPVASPTLTVDVGEQLWFGMASGKVDGTTAFLTGKYKAAPMSNIKYLQNMQKYFS